MDNYVKDNEAKKRETSMIRSAEISELTKLAEIYWAAWLVAFSKHFPPENLTLVAVNDFEDRWRGFFAERRVHSFVYERAGIPIGFITYRVNDECPAEILAVFVSPTSMRLGIGSELIEKALSSLIECKCSRAMLWVVKENANAKRFYECFGFSPTDDKRLIQRYGVELCQLRYEKEL